MIYGDIFLILLELLMCGLCYYIADYATKAFNSKWKLLYAAPALLCVGGIALVDFEISMLGTYLGSLIMLVGFVKEEKKTRQTAALVAVLLLVASFPICKMYKGYRSPNYLKEFEQGFETMKQYYDLAEHKGIDWDALYEEYYPMFEEAQKKHDKIANYVAWKKFTSEFHDGHVNYMSKEVADSESYHEALNQVYGNDYGFSMMGLSNGDIVACNVAEGSAAFNAGIVTGTKIVSWNGQEIHEMIEAVDVPPYYSNMPVLANEEFLKPMAAAGQGADSIEVVFVDGSGKEQTVTLDALGGYGERLEKTSEKLMSGRVETNLKMTQLNDTTACLRLNEMIYDSAASESGNYGPMYEELKTKLQEQKDNGVKNLIIDLRSNNGGDPGFIITIFKLLSKEGEFGYAYSGVWDDKNHEFQYDETTGKYVVGEGTTYEGENFWGDGQIILLVNAYCISAGDHFTAVMAEQDNVTVMGFTSTNCSGQAIRGVNFEKGALSFSHIPTLYENGDIFIDAGADRAATTPLDVKLSMTEEALKAIYDEGVDYEMEQAIKFIEENEK